MRIGARKMSSLLWNDPVLCALSLRFALLAPTGHVSRESKTRRSDPMLKRASLILASALLALGAATGAANADRCSGRNHNTGTVVGAVGGGLIGSAITNGSAVGVVGGAVAGGLAGNAVERDSDCNRNANRGARHHQRHKVYYYDRQHHRHYRYE
jgi:hypothetical protein